MAHMRTEPTISVLLAPRSEPTKLILMSGYSLKEGFSFSPEPSVEVAKGARPPDRAARAALDTKTVSGNS